MTLLPESPSDLRLFFLGDSLVAGVGDPEQQGWAGRVSVAVHCRFGPLRHYNLGIGGETSAELAIRWLGEVLLRWNPEHDARLTFSFGTNDAREVAGQRLLALDQSVHHARSILAEAASRWPTRLVGPPPMLDPAHCARNAELSEALAAVAAEHAVPYLDLMTPLRASQAYWDDLAAGDGVHPGATGYSEIAGLVLRWQEWWFPFQD